MDAIDITARLIGAFYVVGGWLALRAVARDALLDRALSALTHSDADRDDDLRRKILAVGAVLTGISGVALVLLAGAASWLFLLNLAFQAGWLAFARKRYPPQDEEDAVGRRQVARAAVVWAAITAVVVWLDFAGRLGPLTDPLPPLILLVAAVAMLGWVSRHLLWKPGSAPAFDFGDEDEPQPPPARVRLALRYGYQTLWDADDGRALNPYDHLPYDLATRLLTWEDDFHVAVDPGEPDAGPRFDPGDARRHAAEGEAIAAELRTIFGADAVDGPVFEKTGLDGELSAG